MEITRATPLMIRNQVKQREVKRHRSDLWHHELIFLYADPLTENMQNRRKYQYSRESVEKQGEKVHELILSYRPPVKSRPGWG